MPFKDKSLGKNVFSGGEIINSPTVELTKALVNRIVLIGGDWHTFSFGMGAICRSP